MYGSLNLNILNKSNRITYNPAYPINTLQAIQILYILSALYLNINFFSSPRPFKLHREKYLLIFKNTGFNAYLICSECLCTHKIFF